METGVICPLIPSVTRIVQRSNLFGGWWRSQIISYEPNVLCIPTFLHQPAMTPREAHDSVTRSGRCKFKFELFARGNLVEQQNFYSPFRNDEPISQQNCNRNNKTAVLQRFASFTCIEWSLALSCRLQLLRVQLEIEAFQNRQQSSNNIPFPPAFCKIVRRFEEIPNH